ncbi:aminopeptidase P family N-terminal domain-containing protein, partial [Acinetobacter baumannii]
MNTLVNNLAVSELPSLLTIENGEKVSATFSLSEYQNRQSKLRQLMEELEIDHVLFSSIHNINYYADFIYCSFGRFYGLVVSPEKVVSISANIDAGQPWRRTIGDYNVVYTD